MSVVTVPGLINFALHTLGWKAFQDLCATVMSEHMGQDFRIFAPTRDRGQDGYFEGVWQEAPHAPKYSGAFTVQCKSTSKPDAYLSTAAIKSELAKVRKLVRAGKSDAYVLMTNHRLTSDVTLSVEDLLRSAGVKHPLVLGHEWLCRVLTENPRLRRLVPRVYGLGDLGQILDERVFDQAKQIIAYQRSTLDKFVPTRAYRDAARAISSHGFVLLIGEPASGKSTIASLLAVSAADEWKLNTVFADRPDVVQRHWNPNDPAQFFVIDDAFGATQYDQERVNLWNTLFPVISAAIHQGCRIIMTSRDYIFRRAQSELKISAFPLLENSRVIIHVEELSKSEKQQIVYNHMKLGDQPKWFKIRIKPFLSDVTELDIMLPEVARRLGASAFTRKLFLDKENVLDFFKRPHAFLKETLRTISVGEKAAIAVLFMHGGKISTPVSFIQADTQAISALGATIPQTRASFTNLEGSFLQLVPDGDRQLWQYRHPTIRDAFADIVAEDPEQLDIYLAGAPTDTMLGEVTCGNVYLQGARLIVPLERFHSVIKRLSDLADAGRWYRVESFLANRCSESFVRQYFAERPSDLEDVLTFSRWDQDKLNIIQKLTGSDSLSVHHRRKFSRKIRELAIRTWDPACIQESVRDLVGNRTFTRMLDELAADVADYGESWVDGLVENYEGEQEPGDYFGVYKNQLTDMLEVFEERRHPAIEGVRASIALINRYMTEQEDALYERFHNDPEDDDELEAAGARTRESGLGDEARDIFDDVDE
jgi:hypothetical protein